MAGMIHKLRQKIDSFAAQDKENLERLDESLKQFTEIANLSEESWLGEWSKSNFDLYKNFIQQGAHPNIKLSLEMIRKYAFEKVGKSFNDIKSELDTITKKYKDYREDLITELSIYRDKEYFTQEETLLENIEKLRWSMPVHEYVDLKKPRYIVTQFPEEVLHKGLETPPHVSFGGEVLELASNIISINNFIKQTKRILRQIELKIEIKESGKSISGLENLYQIMDRFHIFSAELRNRYDNRETVIVKDEYDVQDLFHALLKIHFEDVRPEENTPSYAGSSTRVDFLLKNEQVIIEIKKTRDNLKDKEIGNQLILDVAHYKSHPDCKRLICFVYDPDCKIRNPRGLESDLTKLSTEELIVEIFIKP